MKIYQELQREQLEGWVTEILGKYNTHKVIKSIRRSLFRYGLDTSLDSEVFQEACFRAFRAIDSSRLINDLEAWFNVVSLNIIREMSRDRKRFLLEEISDDYISSLQIMDLADSEINEVIINDRPMSLCVEKLSKAWEEMPLEQQTLLDMRILQEMTWKEISDKLTEITAEPVSESTVRQRGNRALSSLRKKLS
jgi:RNA polymerase sigma factor (sigma-70 family)